MVYFTRLTDIVTCNLQELLRGEADPQAALQAIVHQIEEGVAGAQRSSHTASQNVQRIAGEMDTLRTQITYWAGKAKTDLQGGDESQARLSLHRKREVENLIAALEQQFAAAAATRDHLLTVMRGIEARHAEAARLLIELQGTADTHSGLALSTSGNASAAPATQRPDLMDAGLEDELAALKRELGG